MTYADRPGFAFPEMTPAVKRLLIANGVVFVVNMLLVGRLSQPDLGAWFAFSWENALDGYGLGLVRLLTYQFTHDWEGLGHIFFNMLTLYFFGTLAERSLGYRGLFKLYVIGGVVAAVAHLAVAALQGFEDVPLIGASGACYAILIYAACYAPRSTVILILFPIQLWVLAVGLVAIGLYSTYVELVRGYPAGVAHTAHLGGAAFGFVTYKLRWFRDYTPYAYQKGFLAGWRERYTTWRRREQARKDAATRQEVDRILEKVHRSGLQSLSAAERRVLEKQSERARRK